MTKPMFKITRNTTQLEIDIVAALQQNGFEPTKKNVINVRSNHMYASGYITDMCDALVATFGGDLYDYDFDV